MSDMAAQAKEIEVVYTLELRSETLVVNVSSKP